MSKQDLEFVSNTQDNKIVGYWRSSIDDVDSPYPFPVANSHKYSESLILKFKEWVRFLESLCHKAFTKTAYFDSRSYRGMSPCRLCDEMNGNKEIDFNGFTFPEGLFHYMLDHCVRVGQEFINMIEKFPVPFHLLNEGPKHKKPWLDDFRPSSFNVDKPPAIDSDMLQTRLKRSKSNINTHDA